MWGRCKTHGWFWFGKICKKCQEEAFLEQERIRTENLKLERKIAHGIRKRAIGNKPLVTPPQPIKNERKPEIHEEIQRRSHEENDSSLSDALLGAVILSNISHNHDSIPESKPVFEGGESGGGGSSRGWDSESVSSNSYESSSNDSGSSDSFSSSDSGSSSSSSD